jgi:hypothetical protein
MDIVLFVELAHVSGVEKNQRNKHVDGTLLCEPEPEFVTTNLNVVEWLDQDDSEQVGNDEPNGEAKSHNPEIGAPIAAVLRHYVPLIVRILLWIMRRRI